MEELLTVEDSFQISGLGIAIIPDFPVPNGWKDQTSTVLITKPDGQHLEAKARFNLSHFNIPDPTVPVGKRWRVVVVLPNCAKEEVPAGSKILVSAELLRTILGDPG